MTKKILIILIVLTSVFSFSQEKKKVYVLDIKQEIGPAVWRHTQLAFDNAKKSNSDLILIHMNTYGGLVDAADSIRTKILNSKIPVYVFIDNNAASAGALISIACDSIYMRDGARIGAATVVTQTGEKAPDKYQAYMRATMRATAESHGADTIINGNDTIVKWFRNPTIAEAMVDETIVVKGIVDSTKILTFTTKEAIENGYCEGKAESVESLLTDLGYEDSIVEKYEPSFLEQLIDFLINPIFQGMLIMLIVGGIYFEMQSPGVGFPLAAAITGAVLYFAPLYMEGLAENWEIIIFIVGLILIALEVFVIPGFGIAGVSGIALVITGLTLSMIDNIVFDYGDFEYAFRVIVKALMTVLIALVLSFFLSIYLSKKILTKSNFSKFVLQKSQNVDDGYVSSNLSKELISKTGKALTDLHPSGKVIVEDSIYDAISEYGFIEKDTLVKIIKQENAQVYVVSNDI